MNQPTGRSYFVAGVSLVLLAGVPSCSEKAGEQPAAGAAETAGFTNVAGETGVRGPRMTFQNGPVKDIREILNPNKGTALWTRPVQLSGLRVQRIISKQLILAGPDADHVVLVQTTEPDGTIQSGQTIDVSGGVDQLSQGLSQWNLKPEEQKLVRNMGGPHAIFVNAREIVVREDPGTE